MTKNKKPFSFTNVMKSVVLAATIVAAIMPCKASAQNNFTIDGTVSPGLRDVKYYIYYYLLKNYIAPMSYHNYHTHVYELRLIGHADE